MKRPPEKTSSRDPDNKWNRNKESSLLYLPGPVMGIAQAEGSSGGVDRKGIWGQRASYTWGLGKVFIAPLATNSVPAEPSGSLQLALRTVERSHSPAVSYWGTEVLGGGVHPAPEGLRGSPSSIPGEEEREEQGPLLAPILEGCP